LYGLYEQSFDPGNRSKNKINNFATNISTHENRLFQDSQTEAVPLPSALLRRGKGTHRATKKGIGSEYWRYSRFSLASGGQMEKPQKIESIKATQSQYECSDLLAHCCHAYLFYIFHLINRSEIIEDGKFKGKMIIIYFRLFFSQKIFHLERIFKFGTVIAEAFTQIKKIKPNSVYA
jgi:hypothetical protein